MFFVEVGNGDSGEEEHFRGVEEIGVAELGFEDVPEFGPFVDGHRLINPFTVFGSIVLRSLGFLSNCLSIISTYLC